jgi:hypothetical protein
MFEMDATLKRCMIKRMLDKPLMTEVAAHNAFVKQTCLVLANKILLCLLSRVSKSAIEKMKSDENIDYVYDNIFQNNLDNTNNRSFLQCRLTLDGNPVNVILEFVPIENENNRGVLFVPDENEDANTFRIVYSCRILDNGIPLSELKFLIGNKKYLVHKLAHLILGKHLNRKSFEINYKEYNKCGAYYYNYPTEFDAYYEQLIVEIDDYVQGDYKKLSNILNTKKQDELIEILMSIVSDSEKVFLRFLNSANKQKVCSKIYDYIDTKISKGYVFEDTFWAANFYRHAKPTQRDLKLYLDEIKEGLLNNESNK